MRQSYAHAKQFKRMNRRIKFLRARLDWIIRDIARKVDLNIEKEIMPGLYYDLESMRRALIDIKSRADHALPTHDWSVLEFGKGA